MWMIFLVLCIPEYFPGCVCRHAAQISLHTSTPVCVAFCISVVLLCFFSPRLVICIMSHKHFWTLFEEKNPIITLAIFSRVKRSIRKIMGQFFPCNHNYFRSCAFPTAQNKWWLAVTKRSCWRQCWDAAKRAKTAERCKGEGVRITGRKREVCGDGSLCWEYQTRGRIKGGSFEMLQRDVRQI